MAPRKQSILDQDWSSHPGAVESLVPVWGSTREAIADWHDGDYAGALGNGILAVTDVVPVGTAAKVGGKVGILAVKGVMSGEKLKASKVLAPVAHLNKSASWESLRKVMTADGRKGPGMHGHHWLVPRNTWGGAVPDRVKNQPWNIKVLTPENHARISHSYRDKPRFDPVRQVWYGAPDWAKAGAVSVGGRIIPDSDQRKRQ